MELGLKNNASSHFILKFKDRILDLRGPIAIGILNITPDSFYDGGKFNSEKEILSQTEKMLREGAAIIDIGAVSTRPGSEEIPEKEEWQRLGPVIKSLVSHFPESIFSVDTYHSCVAEWSVNEGVQMVNDISGGTFDKEMFATIARLKVPFVIMHIKGTPKDMQLNPKYDNVVKEVKNFFALQLQHFANLGVKSHLILDPGFGFGKSVDHNYQLLKNLEAFHDFGFPILAGLSRKSMINKVIKTKPEEALNGTTVLNVLALLNGASILRVHDVKEAVQAIKLVQFYRNA
jgi:dihydropteroate synthase